MKALQELAKVVTSYRLDNVAAFNVYNMRHKDSLYNRFLDGIVKNEFEDDVARLLQRIKTRRRKDHYG